MSKADLERLLEEGALFRILVDSVRDYAIFAMDLAGRIASWNAGAQHIKGYTAEEAIGSLFDVFHTPGDRDRGLPQAMMRAAAVHGSVATEGWRVRKDGTRFWGSVLLTALRNEEGRLVGFAKITRDLTERRLAEEETRARERQLADAHALTGLGSWEWDIASDRVAWSEQLRRIFGLEPGHADPRLEGYLERVHPDDREEARAKILCALASGGEFDAEERILRQDGSERIVHSRGRAVRDSTGRVTRLVGACLDVTEVRALEKRAIELAREQAAREAEEESAVRMRLLVRASEVLSSSLDLDATLENAARLPLPGVADWCAIDLVEPDGTLRRVAVAHPDPAKRALASRCLERFPARRGHHPLWEIIESGEPRHHPDLSDERVLAELASEPGHLEALRALEVGAALGTPLAGRTGVLGVLTLVRTEAGCAFSDADIWFARELGRHAALAIENARLHRELEAKKAEAEEASRAKSAFLAATSHELRTPLNAIVGYADLLELGVHGTINEAQREALVRIKTNQRALLALINDVLNFAKLEAGRLELATEAVEVDDLLAEMRAMVAPQMAIKGLHYTYGACPRGLVVRGDRDRTEQILLNLLTNAIKFTETGGIVELSATEAGDHVRLTVRDSGIGIPPEELDAIFDPFVQVGRRPTGKGERGVGLGLAISRDLADAMGGALSVESAVGSGSTFTLSLPRANGLPQR